MFEKDDERLLLNHLSKNQVILFLGAGFSCMAKNILGETLPMGDTLTRKIWELLFPGKEYESTSLKMAFQALLTSRIGANKIRSFLEDNLLVTEYPDFYNNLSNVFWNRIYTTNIDNLVEKIYSNNRDQKLEIISYPESDIKERDQFLERVQIFHLNGKLKCEPQDLIFAQEQYGRNVNLIQPFYLQFTSEYSNKSTVFIGSTLEEDFLWQYIEERKFKKQDIQELRLRSFLISPTISALKEAALSKYNIIGIKATVEDFMKWIEKVRPQLPEKETILQIINPTWTIIAKSENITPNKKSLKEFSLTFEVVPIDPPSSVMKSYFLLGAEATWSDILNNFDAKREITDLVINKVKEVFRKNELKIFALLGSAGCGKTTILKRIAHSLSINSYTVYFTNSDNLLSPQDLSESLNAINKKVVLVFDYSSTIVSKLHLYVKELENCKIFPLIIIAARYNDFERLATKQKAILELEEISIIDLSKNEIKNIIEVLEYHHLEGTLKDKRIDEQIAIFEKVAKNQLLIAMREATSGERFDLIIKNEFQNIKPDEAQILCLCVALATDAGYKLSKEQFILCSQETPADSLYYLARNLKGIIVSDGIVDNNLMIRHKIIAENYIYSTASRDKLKQAYLRLLKILSTHIIRNNKRFYGFNLYKDLINHKKIYHRMGNNIDDARFIFEQMMDNFNNDYQFWHQYGTLELLAGQFDYAENYLSQAKALCPSDTFIDTSFGNLYLKRAIQSDSAMMALTYFEKGEEILQRQIINIGSQDTYCFHVYCAQTFNYINVWIKNEETKKQKLKNLLKISEQAIFLHPKHKQLLNISDLIKRSLYNMAIPISTRPKEPTIET